MSSNFSRYKQGFLTLAVVLAQTVAVTPSVWAADGSVRIAGQVVITNKAAAGSQTADQRTEAIQRNLDNALVAAKNRSPQAVDIVYAKGVPIITLDGYQIVTVDDANAKADHTTPALLAKKWADGIRQSLVDTGSVTNYIAQLTGDYRASAPAIAAAPQAPSNYEERPSYASGYTATPNYPPYNGGAGGGPNYGGSYGGGADQYGGNVPQQRQGRVVYAPAGLTMSSSLSTSISSQVAQPGDLIEAKVTDPVTLGDGSIPAGSTLVGQIVQAKSGGFFSRSGSLEIKFNRLRTPDGVETPITAHIVGGIGKYNPKGSDGQINGEGWGTKVGQGALRTAIGAGAGAALGTAIGAIASRGHRVGTGAWSGTAIGGGLGAVDSMTLRKGNDVKIPAGQRVQVQLDAPVSISAGGQPPYTGTY